MKPQRRVSLWELNSGQLKKQETGTEQASIWVEVCFSYISVIRGNYGAFLK